MDRTDRLLIAAAAVFALAVLVHGADHVRRGVDATGRDVVWVGTAAIAVEVAVVVLAVQRHRWAPLAALAVGGTLATGYVVVHFLPERSWLSDALSSGDKVNALSWAAASFEVLAALGLVAAGVVALRARGGLAGAARSRPGVRPLAASMLHPVSSAMIAGNAVILALTIGDL